MAKQPRILAGQTAAITGGARGIGRVTAQAFLRQGMRVAIGDVDLPAAQQTAAEIGPDSAVGLPLDVTDRASFAEFFDDRRRTARPGGHPDQQRRHHADRPVPRRGRRDRAADPRHQRPRRDQRHEGRAVADDPRGRGHVVNIASQAGKYGFPGGATYCASKAAVINLSRAVRKELRGSGVEISVISPVAVNTELGLGLAEPRQRQFRKIEPQQVADAIVETLRVPKFDVHVPKQLSTQRAARRADADRRAGRRSRACPTPMTCSRRWTTGARARATSCAPRAPSRGCRRRRAAAPSSPSRSSGLR